MFIILFILYYIFIHKDQIQPQKRKAPPAQPRPPETFTDDPYAILGISRSSTDEQIKTAYRDLSKKNHPDLVAHMSEDFQKMAEEKLKKLNWAFGEIKKSRSL